MSEVKGRVFIEKARELLDRPTTIAPVDGPTSAIVHMDEWMQLRSYLALALDVVDAVVVDYGDATAECQLCGGLLFKGEGHLHFDDCPAGKLEEVK